MRFLPGRLGWRISAWYFVYFAVIGVLFPFWPLYLEHLGFGREAIGRLFALLIIGSVVAPFAWAWVADHGHRRMHVVRGCCLCAALCLALAARAEGYAAMALAMAGFGLFWSAVLPQFEANTFAHLGRHAARYPELRVWGSLGFVVMVVALGAATAPGRAGIIPAVLVAVTLVLAAATWTVPQAREEIPAAVAWRGTFDLRQVLALLLVVFIGVSAHQPYYTFYSLVLESHGYPRNVIGGLWALGVLSEIAVFWVLGRRGVRATRNWLLLGLAAAMLRWILLARGIETYAVLVFAQVLHAGSFALFFGGSIQLVNAAFPARWRGRGQALLSSTGYGAGGAFGAWVSGIVIARHGAEITFLLAAAGSATALALALGLLRGPNRTSLEAAPAETGYAERS